MKSKDPLASSSVASSGRLSQIHGRVRVELPRARNERGKRLDGDNFQTPVKERSRIASRSRADVENVASKGRKEGQKAFVQLGKLDGSADLEEPVDEFAVTGGSRCHWLVLPLFGFALRNGLGAQLPGLPPMVDRSGQVSLPEATKGRLERAAPGQLQRFVGRPNRGPCHRADPQRSRMR